MDDQYIVQDSGVPPRSDSVPVTITFSREMTPAVQYR